MNKYAANALYLVTCLTAAGLSYAATAAPANLFNAKFGSNEGAVAIFILAATVLSVYPGMIECRRIWFPLFGNRKTPIGAITLGVLCGFLIRLV